MAMSYATACLHLVVYFNIVLYSTACKLTAQHSTLQTLVLYCTFQTSHCTARVQEYGGRLELAKHHMLVVNNLVESEEWLVRYVEHHQQVCTQYSRVNACSSNSC